MNGGGAALRKGRSAVTAAVTGARDARAWLKDLRPRGRQVGRSHRQGCGDQ